MIHTTTIILFGVLSLIVCVVLLVLSYIFTRRLSIEALDPYECGFEPFNGAHNPFYIGFILIALLFLLFDLELLMLYPFVSHVDATNMIIICFFVGLLVIAFIYEWWVDALTPL